MTADGFPNFILIVIAGLILLAVWEVWICEGTHLGKRFVIWTYDLAAFRYDRIKGFDQDWERKFLGEPVSTQLSNLTAPKMLDVGSGTGRMARALRSVGEIQNTFINLEPSRKMSRLGRSKTGDTAPWVRAWATPLPFPSDCFEMVSCLEVLEFTPDPASTVEEIRRVLRPGGWLLITNRVSREAPLILGKTMKREHFPHFLVEHGFREVELYPWQVDYDLIWARKGWDLPV
jgi:ubiquinone/menaquinone biosynthesis C-methylase UbiE